MHVLERRITGRKPGHSKDLPAAATTYREYCSSVHGGTAVGQVVHPAIAKIYQQQLPPTENASSVHGGTVGQIVNLSRVYNGPEFLCSFPLLLPHSRSLSFSLSIYFHPQGWNAK